MLNIQFNSIDKNPFNTFKDIINSLIFVILMIFTCSSSADIVGNISLGDKLNIKSTILGENRTIIVHKPAGYQLSNEHYPVIYLLDGEFNLLYTAGIVDYLHKNQMMPKVVIVSIHNTNRVRDFTPTPSKEGLYGPLELGGADKFLSFIEDELKPEIAKQYRVNSYSALIGHSYGGLLSIYSQQVRPSLFNAHIVISPSIFYDSRTLIKSAAASFEANRPSPSFIYMTVADEYEEFFESIKAYSEVLKQLAPQSLFWKLEHLENENHMSAFHPATFQGLKLLFKDWYIKDVPALLKDGNIEGIKHYYQKLSATFGYDIDPPSEMITAAGFYFLSNKRVDEAVSTFKINTTRYPSSGMAHFNLAQAYKASGEISLAKKLIIKACNIGKDNEEIGHGMFCHEASLLSK